MIRKLVPVEIRKRLFTFVKREDISTVAITKFCYRQIHFPFLDQVPDHNSHNPPA